MAPISPEQLARWCGPAAVASALGITRVEAAERILAARISGAGSEAEKGKCRAIRYRKPGVSTIGELAVAMGGEVQLIPRIPGSRLRPTLSVWLRANPTADAVIRVTGHFVHVRNGAVVEDNKFPSLRKRVTHIVLVPGTPTPR